MKPPCVQRVPKRARHEKGTICPTVNQEQIAREQAPLRLAIQLQLEHRAHPIRVAQTTKTANLKLATLALPQQLHQEAATPAKTGRKTMAVAVVETAADAVAEAVVAEAAVSSRTSATRVIRVTAPSTTRVARTLQVETAPVGTSQMVAAEKAGRSVHDAVAAAVVAEAAVAARTSNPSPSLR